MSVIHRIGKYAESLSGNFVWANTYGLGRALLATGLLITMVLNDITLLVNPLGEDGMALNLEQMSMIKLSLYHLFPENFVAVKVFTIVVLLLVISGWRPRITGILHWWVAFSFTASALVVDGGDQIAQVLSLLLVPLCLADGRKWHWTTKAAGGDSISMGQKMVNLVAVSTVLIIQMQVAFIYFHACVGKFKVEEWINGTSLFYWIQDPIFGTGEGLRLFLIKLFANPYIMAFTTWSVLVFELSLFVAWFLAPKWRRVFLRIGLLFHFSIIFLHGLVSFFFTMAAALVLYLGPRQGIDFKKWSLRLRKFLPPKLSSPKTFTAQPTAINN